MCNTSCLGDVFLVIHYSALGIHTLHTHRYIELIILHREHNALTLHQVCAGSNCVTTWQCRRQLMIAIAAYILIENSFFSIIYMNHQCGNRPYLLIIDHKHFNVDVCQTYVPCTFT